MSRKLNEKELRGETEKLMSQENESELSSSMNMDIY